MLEVRPKSRGKEASGVHEVREGSIAGSGNGRRGLEERVTSGAASSPISISCVSGGDSVGGVIV
jgi:hypothetical protein